MNIVRILLILFFTNTAFGQNTINSIEVKIINIDNSDGKMMIGLYASEDNWLKTPFKGLYGKIVNGTCEAVFENIEDGIYAITVFHDENDDDELDTNFLGIPKEDIGSSNDAPAIFGPPKWKDAKFEVKGGTIKQVINL